MDRIIEYPMEQIVVDDFLNQRVADMIALGKLISALLGTQTAVEGLACTPTSPASMDVQVAPGQIFFLEAVDTTTYGDLSPTANILGHNIAANAATIMKQGLILSETTFPLTAPSTSGDSVNYLISAQYEDKDTEDVVLNYYNSSNPAQPLQGQNNSGTAQPTLRQGKCVLTLTAGTAAATGAQQTPAVPSGQVGLYVITVAYGQTSITSSSISVYPGAPFLSQKLFNLMNESGTIVADTLDVTGTLTIPNATANNEPPALSQLFIGNRKAVFTSSGTWTVPDFVDTIWVSGCAGGGGGGGGGGTVGSSGDVGGGGGGGGGAGQSTLKQAISVTGGHVLSVSIGAGGGGGAGGSSSGSSGSNGGSGGNTVLTDSTSSTTLLTLSGGGSSAGGDGQASTSAGLGSGGSGGNAGTGYPAGQYGSDGNYTGNGGSGASGPFGGGGGAGRAGTGGAYPGASASGFGAGGGGGGGVYGGSAAAGDNGGNGAPGFLVIEW